jgi:hypothetical protein
MTSEGGDGLIMRLSFFVWRMGGGGVTDGTKRMCAFFGGLFLFLDFVLVGAQAE